MLIIPSRNYQAGSQGRCSQEREKQISTTFYVKKTAGKSKIFAEYISEK